MTAAVSHIRFAIGHSPKTYEMHSEALIELRKLLVSCELRMKEQKNATESVLSHCKDNSRARQRRYCEESESSDI